MSQFVATGRTAAEAVHEFLPPLQRAVSCVTSAILLHDGDYRPEVLHWTRLSQVRTPLRGQHPLTLEVGHRFTVQQADPARPGWVVTVVAYEFALRVEDASELLAYHWHPIGQSHIRTPHLHLGPALAIPSSPAANAHLPTGIVTLPDVLRMAITDLGVTSQREDWDRVLAGVHSAS